LSARRIATMPKTDLVVYPNTILYLCFEITLHMKLRFLYTPKPKQFEYKPRFFKPEEDEKLIHKIQDGPGKSTQEAYRRFRRDAKSSNRKRNQSVLIYVVIILVLLYVIFVM